MVKGTYIVLMSFSNYGTENQVLVLLLKLVVQLYLNLFPINHITFWVSHV